MNWLGDTNSPNWVALVSVRLWRQVGFYMILCIAGLQHIPHRPTRPLPWTGPHDVGAALSLQSPWT